MEYTFKKLGDIIALVDERNSDYETEELLGVAIEKRFMPSVANVIGTDLSKYKVVVKDRFACNPMHVGRDEKMPIARYDDNNSAIVSPAYFTFEITNDAVLPRYLELWFNRTDFDRRCWFATDASVRGGLTWEAMCNIPIVLPTIHEQQMAVARFNAIDSRILQLKELNDVLEAQVQFQFDTLFGSESLLQDDTEVLSLIANINPNRPLRKGSLAWCYDMATLPTTGCTPIGGTIKPYNGGMRFENGDTILARITPCLENGKAAFINFLDEGSIAFGSTEYIVLSPRENLPSEFLYFLARNARFIGYAVQHMNGSSGRQRVAGADIEKYPIAKPDEDALKRFEKLAKPVVRLMYLNSLESMKLELLKTQMLETMPC